MALKEFEFGFGQTTQKVMLPEEHISDVLEGNPTPACDVEEATLECMRHPIGSRPLQEIVRKGDKVCIVCADITRTWNHSDQFVIHIVNELNRAEIPDSDICILFAQGTHRAQTPEEDIRVVGKEVASRIKLYQHDCKTRTNSSMSAIRSWALLSGSISMQSMLTRSSSSTASPPTSSQATAAAES